MPFQLLRRRRADVGDRKWRPAYNRIFETQEMAQDAMKLANEENPFYEFEVISTPDSDG